MLWKTNIFAKDCDWEAENRNWGVCFHTFLHSLFPPTFFLYPFWPRCAWFPLQKIWRLYFFVLALSCKCARIFPRSGDNVELVLTFTLQFARPSHWQGFMLFLVMFFWLGIGFFPVFSACTYMYPCTQTHTHTHGRTCVRVGR